MSTVAPILTLAGKDLRLLVRDRAAVFFTMVFPVVFGLLFGLIFGEVNNGEAAAPVRVLIVDEDGTADSRSLATRIGMIDSVDATVVSERADAIDHVRQGNAALMVLIPAGYSGALDGVMRGEPVPLGVVYDPTRGPQRLMIEGQLQGAVFGQIAGLMTDPARRAGMAAEVEHVLEQADGMPAMQRMMLRQAMAMLRVPGPAADEDGNADSNQAVADSSGIVAGSNTELDATGAGFAMLAIASSSVTEVSDAAGDGGQSKDHGGRIGNAFELTIPQGAAWGLMGCVLGFGLSMSREAQAGTLRRLLASPIKRWQLLAGKGLACFAAAIAVQAVLYLIAVGVFDVRPDSWAHLAIAIVAGGFGFSGLMLAFAAASRSAEAAEGMGRAALLTLALVGGAGVPLYFMPGWMQSVASISPFKWLILAHEQSIWRAASTTELLGPVAVLLAMGAAGAAVAVVVFVRDPSRAD